MSFLDNVKIGKKLIAGFLIVVALMCIISVVSYTSLQTLDASTKTLYNDHTVGMQELGTTDAALWTIRGDVYKYILIPGEKDALYKDIDTQIADINHQMELLKATKLDSDEKAAFAKFQSSWMDYQAALKEIKARNEAGDTQGVMALLAPSAAASTARLEMDAALEELKTMNVQGAEQIYRDGETSATNSSMIIIILSIAAVAIALALGFILSRSIAKPIGEATEMIGDMSNGKLDRRLNMKRKDEVGIMAEAMDKCCDVLQGLVAETDTLSKSLIEGKLTKRGDTAKFQGGYQAIVNGINHSVDSVVGFIDSMPVPAMIINKEFEIQYINRIGATLGGKTSDQLVNARSKCFDHFRTSDCRTAKCACQQSIQTGLDAKSETDAHPGGLNLDIAYSAVPIKDEQGRTIGAFEVVTDQTAIKQAQRFAKKIADYSDVESKKLTEGLGELAKGNLDLRLKATEGDADTAAPKALFETMYASFDQCIQTLNGLINEAKALSKAAVEGKLTVRGDARKFMGGYSEIIQGVNDTLDAFIGPVNEAMKVSDEYARANFTARFDEALKIQGDFVAFKKALNNIGIEVSKSIEMIKNQMSELAGSAEEANASVEEVASGSNQVAKSAGVVSSNAEKSGEGVNQVLKAMEDLSATVTDVASQTENVSKLTRDANDLSKKGAELANKAEKGMGGITTSSDHVEKIIIDIRQQMDEIGKIVGLISDLANQTNLLALNAAIEAARAGDAGRGFAVVATEVKSLAQESQTSAENIAQMINNLQKKSQEAAESMSGATKNVKEGSIALTDTLEVFNKIVLSVDEISANIAHVASATEEQAASVEEITASINEVGGLMQNTVKEAMDSAAASEETSAALDQIVKVVGNVNTIVDKVSKEVSHFRV